MKEAEKKFVEAMLQNAEKSHKTQPESKADLAEVEKLTDSIRTRIQRGE
jgi:hypothetical protein